MFQFIGIVGAILVAVSFFLTWGTYTLGSLVENYAGMDFFNRDAIDPDAWQNMIPMVALILAIVALVISVVPGEYLGGAKTEKLLGIVSIFIAIVLLIVTILFMVWFNDFAGMLILGKMSFGIGTYLCLIGSILVFIVGVLPVIKNFLS